MPKHRHPCPMNEKLQEPPLGHIELAATQTPSAPPVKSQQPSCPQPSVVGPTSGQHGWPGLPHAAHWPATHTSPAAQKSAADAIARGLAGQHGPPVCPHGISAALRHTSPPTLSPEAMHRPPSRAHAVLGGSASAPAS